MRLRHPSTEDLQHWLADDTDDAADGLTAHVDNCERCATIMEELAAEAAEEAATSERTDLGEALSEVLAPPPDYTDRLIVAVNDQLSSRQVFGLVADLFAAGLETSRMLLVEDDHDTD